jgi:hypothetical protein
MTQTPAPGKGAGKHFSYLLRKRGSKMTAVLATATAKGL